MDPADRAGEPARRVAPVRQEADHGQGRLVLISGEAGLDNPSTGRVAHQLQRGRWLWAASMAYSHRPRSPFAYVAGELERRSPSAVPDWGDTRPAVGALLRQLNEMHLLSS
jgi:hypothetical protein